MFTSKEIQRAAAAAKKAVAQVRGGKAIIPATPREVQTFAVGAPPPNGGGCGGRCRGDCSSPRSAGCRPSSFNACYHDLAAKHRCPLKVCSGGIRDLAAATGGSFRVQPTLANYFLPVAIRAIARDNAAPSTELVARMTAVHINGVPQEVYNNTAPAAAGIDGVEINAYSGKTGVGGDDPAANIPAYEVAWGPFSRDSMADQLQIYVVNDDPALAADIRVEIWGYPLGSLPQGWTCGHHPARQQSTPET